MDILRARTRELCAIPPGLGRFWPLVLEGTQAKRRLFDRVYAPLTAGLLQPVAGDSRLQQKKRSQLDRLYQQIADDIANLFNAVGLHVAA